MSWCVGVAVSYNTSVSISFHNINTKAGEVDVNEEDDDNKWKEEGQFSGET